MIGVNRLAWRAPGLLASLLVFCALQLGGCASVPTPATTPASTSAPASLDEADVEATSPSDPWERFNRHIFAFNELLDKVAVKPVAQVYQAVVPNLVRLGVRNFFGNLGDVWTSANLMLQAKPRQGLEMGMRSLVNTFFGLGGLLDPADEMGLERTTVEDFGQTLGFWGLHSGPYLVLPVLGPSTLRDATGLALDFQDSGASLAFKGVRERNIGTAVQLINTRVNLLNAGRVLDEIALDKYVLLRDAYLARRKSLIYDGEPPEEESAPPAFKSIINKDLLKGVLSREPQAAPAR